MKITLVNDAGVIEMPFGRAATIGFRAETIEITAVDVYRMALLAKRDPDYFQELMKQLEMRFEGRIDYDLPEETP